MPKKKSNILKFDPARTPETKKIKQRYSPRDYEPVDTGVKVSEDDIRHAQEYVENIIRSRKK